MYYFLGYPYEICQDCPSWDQEQETYQFATPHLLVFQDTFFLYKSLLLVT